MFTNHIGAKFIGMGRVLLISFLMAVPTSEASIIKVDKTLTYKQEVVPEKMDNHLFSTFFSNNKSVYNLKGFENASTGGPVVCLKVNPAGHSFAVISGKPGKTKVAIFPINASKVPRQEIKDLRCATALCYSPDSRRLMVAGDGLLRFYDSKTLDYAGSVKLYGNPVEIMASPNNNFIAAVYDDRVDVVNLASGTIRHSVNTGMPSSAAFGGATLFGVLTSDGNLKVYNASDFSLSKEFAGLGRTGSLFFNPTENYAGYVADGNRIEFINLYEPTDRPVIYDSSLTSARLLHDGKENLYAAYTTADAIKYKMISGFDRNNLALVNREVESLMMQWMKMRPGETQLEHEARVNSETIAEQRRLFAREVSTRMALTDGLGAFGDITLGRYNPSTGVLIVSLANGRDIFLNVPVDEMDGFGDGNNLRFSNHVYLINENNGFDLVYVEVFNPTNGKTYVYDNSDYRDMNFLVDNDNFVSLNLIRQSTREDMILKGIKDAIITEAMSRELLSDHTTVNVDTHIEPDKDADGKPIRNYHVDFTYTVDSEGSATEDFAPGRYKTSDSHAATSLLKIISKAFKNEFSSYISAGKRLIINITGSADAAPIRGAIAYDGSFGEFVDEPCVIDGSLTTVTVTPREGIRTNEQLAYMRARGVQHEMMASLPELRSMDVMFNHNIEVSQEKGAEYRHIDVSLIFIDAF